ncbi:MAG: CarD family transcriptional regulator [Nitrospirae bacterium]|jgi:CRP-like cAMP-binding protein|nr:CarD family transcriptional regulator [Nitrospirota bacterium]
MPDNTIRNNLCKFSEEIPFSFLNEEDFEKIACFFESVTYPAQTVIFKEGDPAEFIGFVLSGKIEVKKQTEFKGNQLIIAILTKGALVGELSIFDEHKRSTTHEAVEETSMLKLTNEAFDALLRDYPEIGIKILKGLIRILSLRLRKTTERLASIF